MQELKLIVAESDRASLVLRAVDSEAEFYLPVTDELRSVVGVASLTDATPNTAPTAQAAPADAAEATEASEPSAETDTAAAPATSSDSPASATVAQAGVEKKRRHRIRISMSPRTIQDRVRHGATVEELAAEADTDPARIEPYAWPILQERSRIAELAHSAHPVTPEGPSRQTLWEVLATSLAARNVSLSDATWDAHQDDSRRWIITVSWEKETAGQSSVHDAQFLFEQAQPGPHLAHPLSSVASDLTDPRFGQPVRRIAAVTPLIGRTTEDDYSEYDAYDDNGDAIEPSHSAQPRDEQRRTPRTELRTEDGQSAQGSDDFLLHPDTEEPKAKRRRKAVTPHWEDVLLGVRTNPRKKK